jgi:signal transduction histidine kinase
MSDAISQVGPRRALWGVVLGSALALCAMGVITWHALRLEQREHNARVAASFQASLRLALWRIDSAMTPIIAREAARPYYEYQPFYPADRALDAAYKDIAPGEVLVPSPLLTSNDELVKLHYQVSVAGEVSSPQAPMGRMQEIAEGAFVTPYSVRSKSEELTRLALNLTRQNDAEQPPASDSTEFGTRPGTDSSAKETSVAGNTGTGILTAQQEQASPVPSQGREEFEARRVIADKANAVYNRQATEQVELQRGQMSAAANEPDEGTPTDDLVDRIVDAAQREHKAGTDAKRLDELLNESNPTVESALPTLSTSDAPKLAVPAPSPEHVSQNDERFRTHEGVEHGPFRPRWLWRAAHDAELVFERDVRVGRTTMRQGFLLDWTRVRVALLEPVRPLFPDATIRPIGESIGVDIPLTGRMLATIPAEFVVDPPAPGTVPAFTPLRAALFTSWLLVLGSITALAGVTRASLALAERRGRFVSAVTHELRTPLTTFRLYSQMLAEGMIPDEDGRRAYARTLQDESLRLSRIVESVLDYARLGKDSPPKLESLTLGALRARIEPEMHEACRRASLTLEASSPGPDDAPIRTDPALVGRVVGNLVDNACKYAGAPPDARAVLTWTIENARLIVRVRDFGPGVPTGERSSVFAPFIRGKSHSHGQQPGLGLGLALSRALAQRLGGDLRLTGHERGAEFTLDVPA